MKDQVALEFGVYFFRQFVEDVRYVEELLSRWYIRYTIGFSNKGMHANLRLAAGSRYSCLGATPINVCNTGCGCLDFARG